MRQLGALALSAAMVVVLPLLGALAAGRPLAPYLELPPIPVPVEQPPFRWAWLVTLAALVLACLAPIVTRVVRSAPGPAPARRGRRLPWWGGCGGLLLAVAWWLAWTRQGWFAPLQAHTFFPLWLGAILAVSGLTERRAGRCLVSERPWRWLALFPVSAAFWWSFEYLNRFVGNWHYVDVGTLTAGEYFWRATLSFSTVLPAVVAVRDYLATFPALSAGLGRAWVLAPRRPALSAWAGLALAAVGLAGIGRWPGQLYPLLWLAPLAALLACQHLLGLPTIVAPLAAGDWRGVWLAALAGLACGLLWEMWNAGSLARWEYTLPYVERFRLFAMPVLGYAGYLPFGLECLAVAAALTGERPPGAAGAGV